MWWRGVWRFGRGGWLRLGCILWPIPLWHVSVRGFGVRLGGRRTVRGDVPEELLCGRDEQAVLGEVGGDGVECEETEAHEEGCRFHEEPHGHHGREEGERGEEDEDACGAVWDAPFVEALV